MQYKVFSIRDRAADVFSQPFYAPTVGTAVRMFTDEINRNEPNNNLFKHPDDFDLYELGSFDDNVGRFTTDEIRQVAVGKDVKVS